MPSAYSANREEIQKYHLGKLVAAVMKRRGGRRLSLTVLRRRYDLHEKLNGNSAAVLNFRGQLNVSVGGAVRRCTA